MEPCLRLEALRPTQLPLLPPSALGPHPCCSARSGREMVGRAGAGHRCLCPECHLGDNRTSAWHTELRPEALMGARQACLCSSWRVSVKMVGERAVR